MLQWMGGSRRKVNNSRNSTLKRQKQYFEQRRRRLQQTAGQEEVHVHAHDEIESIESIESIDHNHCSCLHGNQSRNSTLKRQKQYFEQRRRRLQQTAGQEEVHAHDEIESIESIESIDHNHNLHREHSRSLDILSLLNLSKQCRQTPPHAKSLPTDALNHCEPSTYDDTLLSGNSLEFKQAARVQPGSLPGNQLNTVSPNKTGPSFDASDGHNNVSNVIGGKLTTWKSTDQQLSVIDLLGDDGPDGDPEVKRKNEDHVSFSVEGLGNVGRETPVHSPRRPGRDYLYGCSSPVKAVRKLQSSKNFSFMDDLETDVMMQDIDIASGGNAYQVPSCRKRVVNTLNNGLSTFDDCMHFDEDNNSTKASFGNRDTFHGLRGFNDDTWNARSSFRDCDYFEEKGHDYDVFDGRRHDCDFLEERRRDYDFFEERRRDYDFFEEKRHDYDFLEEKRHDTTWKKRSWQKDHDSGDTFGFNNEIPDFTFEGLRPLEKWKTKRFNISEPPDPYYRHQEPEPDEFVTSDFLGYCTSGKNFSFRDMTSHPNRGLFSTDGPRNNLGSLSEESSSSTAVGGKIEKSPSMGKQSTRGRGKIMSSSQDFGQRRENARVHTNMSNPSRSKAARHTNISFEGKLTSDNSWLLEEDWQSAETNCDSLDRKLWNEDPFSAFTTVPKMEYSFQRSKHDVSGDYSRYGSGLIPEKLAFFPSSSHMQSFDSPDAIFEETKREMYEDTKKQRRTSDSSQIAGSDGDSVHPDLINQEVVTVTENLEKTPSAQSGGSQLEKDVSTGNTEVLSEETEHEMNTMDCGSECSIAKRETREAIEKNTSSSEIRENMESNTNVLLLVIHDEGAEVEAKSDDVDD